MLLGGDGQDRPCAWKVYSWVSNRAMRAFESVSDATRKPTSVHSQFRRGPPVNSTILERGVSALAQGRFVAFPFGPAEKMSACVRVTLPIRSSPGWQCVGGMAWMGFAYGCPVCTGSPRCFLRGAGTHTTNTRFTRLTGGQHETNRPRGHQPTQYPNQKPDSRPRCTRSTRSHEYPVHFEPHTMLSKSRTTHNNHAPAWLICAMCLCVYVSSRGLFVGLA